MTDLQMYYAIRSRDIKFIETYINNGFDVNKFFKGIPFIYHLCNLTETLDIFTLFIDSGAKLNVIHDNANIIDYIVKSPILGLNHLEYTMVEYIYNYFVSHNYDFNFNIQHISLIIRENRFDIFNLFSNLIEFSSFVQKYKQKLFWENIKYSSNTLFLQIYTNVELLNYRNHNNETALHVCLNKKNYNYAKYLMNLDKNNILINDNNNIYLMSPLMICCQLNSIQDFNISSIFDILINKPTIDVNKVCSRGHNAFMYACQHNNLCMINKLIEKGANIFQVNNDGDNSLIITCMRENLDVAKLLISNKMDILFQNNKDPKNCKRCIDYLLSKKDRMELIKLSNIPFDLYLTFYILSF
jgi:ankyrin repeat protein